MSYIFNFKIRLVSISIWLSSSLLSLIASIFVKIHYPAEVSLVEIISDIILFIFGLLYFCSTWYVLYTHTFDRHKPDSSFSFDAIEQLVLPSYFLFEAIYDMVLIAHGTIVVNYASTIFCLVFCIIKLLASVGVLVASIISIRNGKLNKNKHSSSKENS